MAYDLTNNIEELNTHRFVKSYTGTSEDKTITKNSLIRIKVELVDGLCYDITTKTYTYCEDINILESVRDKCMKHCTENVFVIYHVGTFFELLDRLSTLTNETTVKWKVYDQYQEVTKIIKKLKRKIEDQSRIKVKSILKTLR